MPVLQTYNWLPIQLIGIQSDLPFGCVWTLRWRAAFPGRYRVCFVFSLALPEISSTGGAASLPEMIRYEQQNDTVDCRPFMIFEH